MRVGVLALQGDFAAHQQTLEALGHDTVPVRTERDLADLDGLVLPGGESTTQLKLIDREQLRGALDAFIASGRPVLATCAGLILAAARVENPVQASFGWVDVAVSRNAWGRQLDSFEGTSDDGRLQLVFIRAPRIIEVGPRAQVLATLDGEPILIRDGRFTAATFHPELTDQLDIHRDVFGG